MADQQPEAIRLAEQALTRGALRLRAEEVETLACNYLTLCAQVERLQALVDHHRNENAPAVEAVRYWKDRCGAGERLQAAGQVVAYMWEHVNPQGEVLAKGLAFDKVEPTDNANWRPAGDPQRVATRVTALMGHAPQPEPAPVAGDDLADIVRQFLSVHERSSAHLGEMMRDAGVTSVTVPGKHGELLAENEALVDRARAALAAQLPAEPAVLVPLTDEQKSDIFLRATGEPDYSTKVADATIAEFCRINGLTVGGSNGGGAHE